MSGEGLDRRQARRARRRTALRLERAERRQERREAAARRDVRAGDFDGVAASPGDLGLPGEDDAPAPAFGPRCPECGVRGLEHQPGDETCRAMQEERRAKRAGW